ncbi:MAG TPA: cell division protein FtsQ/DivIB [Novosphingobium sp.]
MSQTIRRKAPSARKVAAAQGTARKVKAARARTGSAYDNIMAWLPITEEQLHRILLAIILGGAAALAWVVAGFAGLPSLAGQQLAQIAGDAGFEVRRVDVRGVKNLNELKVYERVLAERDRAMPLVDIDALRAELLALSWVEDARVSRQLPDTLVVDIVERTPHAVLRKPGRLVLIDATGRELEPVSPARAKGRLIVSGPGAGQQVVALSSLLEAAPALKPQIREAEWVGNRRWNLTFKTGQVLALPEGDKRSASALMAFARLDGTNRLIGGRVAAFDMRASDRIYLRVPDGGRTDAGPPTPSSAKKEQKD